MNLKTLTEIIHQTHEALLLQATKSVNICHTLRNWLIGYHITEYKLKGQDRAQYGKNVIEELALELKAQAVPSCSARRLWEYRKFYQVYPEILQAVPAELKSKLNQSVAIPATMQAVTAESSMTEFPNADVSDIPRLPIAQLFHSLSFTHFVELIKIDEPLKRIFYEIEAIRGNWSSRELKRQIGSL